ncbi:MAG: OsmC family protein [Holophaga sp.]|nr:OsmC family protein [Holophaga sp.]
MTTQLSIHATHQGGMRVLLEANGHLVPTDYPLPGGEPTVGMTSLQLLLGSLASCSANGLKALLRKEGVNLTALNVHATGQRRETHPTILESIHLAFEIEGENLEATTLERALEFAESHLCPVWVMLRASTPISRSLAIHPSSKPTAMEVSS